MEMRRDDPELANSLRIDERELEAGWSASGSLDARSGPGGPAAELEAGGLN